VLELKQQCAQFVAKERRAQITEILFPFYFFIDHSRDGERVFPYVMHEITDSDHSLGHAGGAPCVIAPEVNLQKK
jgi:hypothetical protein